MEYVDSNIGDRGRPKGIYIRQIRCVFSSKYRYISCQVCFLDILKVAFRILP